MFFFYSILPTHPRKNFSEPVKDLDLLFIFTDLVDDNISTQIAESAKNALKVTILPSSNFNKEKIDKFQDVMDSLIIVEEKNTELMLSVVRCINSIVSESGMVGMGYEDVKSVLEKSKSGRGYVAYGRGKGKQPSIDAVKNAMNSMKNDLSNSKGLLLCFFGCSENLSMLEINEASMLLQEAAHPMQK